jgi:hypothetical protein
VELFFQNFFFAVEEMAELLKNRSLEQVLEYGVMLLVGVCKTGRGLILWTPAPVLTTVMRFFPMKYSRFSFLCRIANVTFFCCLSHRFVLTVSLILSNCQSEPSKEK